MAGERFYRNSPQDFAEKALRGIAVAENESVVNIYEVKDEEEFFQKYYYCFDGFTSPLICSNLRSKSDYGTYQSEQRYMLYEIEAAIKIAEALKADWQLTQLLTICICAYYPICGELGEKYCLQYAREVLQKNISHEETAVTTIEYSLSKSTIITQRFDALLHKLFGSEESGRLEVDIARYVHRSMKKIKAILHHRQRQRSAAAESQRKETVGQMVERFGRKTTRWGRENLKIFAS